MPTTTLYLPTHLGTFTLKADDAGLSSLLFPEEVSIVRLGFCMNNFLVLLTLRVRLTGLHS